MPIRHALQAFGLLAALAIPGAAQEGPWYAGVGIGAVGVDFHPQYTEVADGARSGFHNEASGVQVQALAGRRLGRGAGLSVSLQGTLGLNTAEWSLSLPEEPAELRYTLPWSVLLGVVPELEVGERFTILGEVGGGVGRVHMVKQSSTTSAYDHDEATALLGVGAGVAFQVSPRMALEARYRHLRYRESDFDTHDPGGAVVEHVSDAPRSNGVVLMLTTRF